MILSILGVRTCGNISHPDNYFHQNVFFGGWGTERTKLQFVEKVMWETTDNIRYQQGHTGLSLTCDFWPEKFSHWSVEK